MLGYHCQWLFAFLLVFAYVEEGNCLTCYSCNSTSIGGCRDPFNATLFKETTCKAPNNACLKQKQTPDGKGKEKAEINRGCVPDSFCRLVVSDYCTVCKADLCNSSPVLLTISGFHLINFLILLIYII